MNKSSFKITIVSKWGGVIFTFFILLQTSLYAQTTRNVSGKVTDSIGAGVSNVSVSVKGRTTGAISGDDGSYSIRVPEGAVLVFSSVGFATQEIAVTGSRLDVTLQAETQSAGDEIVVVGYGTQSKRKLTGSVSEIKTKDVVASPVANLTNALAGRLPGLRAFQRSGEPGYDGSGIDIRGFGSALIIVDGVPNSFAQIDPQEIESISILKDASAAVYGVRSANRVVLVTTKKGKKGDAQIEYNGYYGWQNITSYPKLTNAAQFIELSDESDINKGQQPGFGKDVLEKYKRGEGVNNTDWFNEAIRPNAPQIYNNINVSGGGEKTTYFFSIGALQQSGIWKTGVTQFSRYNIRSNISSKIGNGFTADLQIGGRIEDRQFPGTGAGILMSSIVRNYPTYSPYANPKDPSMMYFGKTNQAHQNTLALIQKDFTGYTNDVQKFLTVSPILKYDVPFLKGLSAKLLYSYNLEYQFRKSWQKEYNLYSFDDANNKYSVVYTGQSPTNLSENFYQIVSQNLQASLSYDTEINEAHNLSFLVLMDKRSVNNDNFNAYREYLIDALDQLFAGVDKNKNNGGGAYEVANLRYVGRINYDYKSKYLVEISGSADASANFPSATRWGFFPAVSVGYRISQENFLKNSKAIDDLKIRASWGKLGDEKLTDDDLPTYSFLTGYLYPGNNNYIFGTEVIPGLQDRGLANPNITWFVSRTSNIGIDYSLWNNLLSGSVDIFYRKRTGLLATRVFTLPGTFGATLPRENLNSDNNRGFEIVLNHQKSFHNGFRYMIGANFTYSRARNQYIEQAEFTSKYNEWRNSGSNRWKNIFFGYEAIGQFQSQEEIDNAPVHDGKSNATIVPGDIRYRDYNNDGIIDDNDVHIIGRGLDADMFYGLNLSASYKGFDVSLFFQGAGNNNTYTQAEFQSPMFNGANSLAIFYDRWHREDIYDPNSKWIPGKYPNSYASGKDNNTRFSTFWLKDASYLRLKTIELAYNFTPQLLKSVKIKGVRIYVSGLNLINFTKLNTIDVDPEFPAGRGLYYPQQKIVNVGANIKI